jgi:GTP-binding protein HflX
MAYIARHGEVLSKRYSDSRVIIHCRLPQEALGKIDPREANVSPHVANGKIEDVA